MKKQLPPPTPPCTGGETNARKRHYTTVQRILPLCKGELEGVVKALTCAAGIMGGKQNDFSIGGIYYFNKYVAAKMSYSLVSLDKHAPVDGKQTFSMIQGRIQLSF